MAQWRRFSFFEKQIVKNEDGKAWLRGVDITCMTGNRGIIVIGDATGMIHMADSELSIRQFQAYDHFVSHAIMLQKMNFLITIGDGIDPRDTAAIKKSKRLAEARNKSTDQTHIPTGSAENSTALVKIWRTDQLDREGKPKFVQQIRIFAKYPEEAVTSFAAHQDLSQMAVGLKNGAVILFRTDVKRRSDQRAPVLLQPAAQFPVTGLYFVEYGMGDSRSSLSGVFLYATTRRRGLTSYQCGTRDGNLMSPSQPVVLDERAVPRHCAAVNELGEIAVGQQDAVYFYNPEDRGVCFGFDGEKKYLSFFKHYLLVAHVDPRGRHQINVYDLKNKFIAFNWTLTQGHASRSRRDADEAEEVQHVVSEFGSLFVVSSAGHVYRLTEKDTATKLDILFRKNLYSIAISLAFSSNYDINSIMDIFRMYGDHLYAKGDYDGSVRQYSRTIGHVEPSYVIRRFLDAQRIHNLTTYLEALHVKACANSEHTTLMLNCYTKLKDVKKLDRFICPEKLDDTLGAIPSKVDIQRQPSIDVPQEFDDPTRSNAPVEALTFDVETAISVLRMNYPRHALMLAKKQQEHSWYLKIQLEDISYVDHDEELKPEDKNRVIDSLEYITCLPFAEADSSLRKYGRTLVTHLPEETTDVLKQLCTGRYVPKEAYASSADPVSKSDAADFIHLYVAHPQYLRRFLEYIVAEEPTVSPSIGNTLLELLLQEQLEETTGEESKFESASDCQSLREDAVMAFLDNPRMKYDEDHALILVQMHGIKRGQRYLYAKLHMYHMLVQQFIEVQDDAGVIDEVKKHGDKDPNLWLMALKYFAEAPGISKNNWAELREVLQLIEGNPTIPPLQVIQILSQSKTLPLSVVRPYIINRLKADEARISEDKDEIEKFKLDTNRMQSEIQELQSKATVFQATKCDLCNHELDPPAIHFLCQHSFHQSCVPEQEIECVICAPEHRHVLTLKASLEQKSTNHELFFTQLEGAADGFNTIAEYFGKGIFKPEPPETLPVAYDGRFSNEV